MVLVGVAYALLSTSAWAAISLTVEGKLIGTAFGFATAFYNFGLSIVPEIDSFIIKGTYDIKYFGFFYVSFFWAFLSLIGVICGVFLLIIDRKTGNVLSKITIKKGPVPKP